MISIDEELHTKAQEKGFNISAIAENAVRNNMGTTEVIIDEALNCEFCGVEGKEETAETINQSQQGLVWLYPDEKWICNKCLSIKSRHITK